MTDAHDIDALRARIAAAADAAGDAGWLDMPVPEAIAAGGVLRVPRGAFERWAVSRSGGDHLTVPWEAVSPSGLRLDGDDRYHTDWMAGAGLPLDAMSHDTAYPHREALVDAAYDLSAEVSRHLLDFACTVLLDGPSVTGRVHHPAHPDDLPDPDPDGHPPIVVVRDAGPGWLGLVDDAIGRGGALVCERGGAMAHLVTVLRERALGPIVRMPGALALYPEGSLLCLTPYDGTLRLREDGRASSGQSRNVTDRLPPPQAPYAPVPSSVYDGPPSEWPLRQVGEDELDAMARAKGLTAFASPDPEADDEPESGPTP